jgi:hypothetical protein
MSGEVPVRLTRVGDAPRVGLSHAEHNARGPMGTRLNG